MDRAEHICGSGTSVLHARTVVVRRAVSRTQAVRSLGNSSGWIIYISQLFRNRSAHSKRARVMDRQQVVRIDLSRYFGHLRGVKAQQLNNSKRGRPRFGVRQGQGRRGRKRHAFYADALLAVRNCWFREIATTTTTAKSWWGLAVVYRVGVNHLRVSWHTLKWCSSKTNHGFALESLME